jgi:hypothetical protein
MSVALAVQLTTVPTVAGDGCCGFKSVVMAALDGEAEIISRKSKMSQQILGALNDFMILLAASFLRAPDFADKRKLDQPFIKWGLNEDEFDLIS